MNETEIAFSGDHGTRGWCVTVLKFANFSFTQRKSSDLKENLRDSKKEVKIKMKKIICDCVDFDVEDEEEEKYEEDEEDDGQEEEEGDVEEEEEGE